MAAVLAMLGASCVPEPAAPAVNRPAPVVCGVASYSCNLPFPASDWLVDDPTTATGVRLEVPDGVIDPAVIQAFGSPNPVDDLQVGADGFSPLTPIAFQVPEGLAPGAVPSDGGEIVQVWDATTGERVRVHAEVSQHRNDERGLHNIVTVYPSTRFAPGHQIFAGLTTDLVALGGAPVSVSGAQQRATPATRDLAVRLTPGIAWDRYASATSFTVRSQASFEADVDAMAAQVRAADPSFRNISIVPPLFGGAATVQGEVSILDFRDASGMIPRDGSATGTKRWIEFSMVMPQRPATDAGAPVLVYGHGIVAFKETMLVMAGEAAQRGIATIAIDKPNHGSRTWIDAGHITELIWPQNLARLQSSLMQAALDEVSLITAIAQHGDVFDVSPVRWFGSSGDGVADLDTNSVLYAGTSLGGVVGATVVALEPRIDAAYFQVPGSGIIDVLFHSWVWDALFQSVVPGNAAYGDNHVLTFLAQSLMDRVDNANYLERIAQRGTPVFIAYAVDDGLVNNRSTERIIEALDLPMVGPQSGPITAPLSPKRVTEFPSDGRGFFQISTDHVPPGVLHPLGTHISFLEPSAKDTLTAWLDDRVQDIYRSSGK